MKPPIRKKLNTGLSIEDAPLIWLVDWYDRASLYCERWLYDDCWDELTVQEQRAAVKAFRRQIRDELKSRDDAKSTRRRHVFKFSGEVHVTRGVPVVHFRTIRNFNRIND